MVRRPTPFDDGESPHVLSRYRTSDDFVDAEGLEGNARKRPAPRYVGLSRKEAEFEARKDSWPIRVADLDDPTEHPWTADYVPRRLNMVVRDGRVIRAYYG